MVRRDLKLIARLMLEGKAPEEIARETGTDVRLVRAWCSSPVFRALAEAERSAAAEQGREQRRRFLTPGSGYQPGNAQMFRSGN